MFGSLVTAHRRRLSLTQQDLADETGISVRAIRSLEAGHTQRPRQATVRILADAFGLSGPQREDFQRRAFELAETAADAPAVDWLPRSLPDFVGRRDLIAELSAPPRPGEGPVVRLVDGMPGSGKTSIAVHVARLLAPGPDDARLFIDLLGNGGSPLEPAAAATNLLRQLGVPSDRMPADPDGRLALWRYELADRRCVVVLDNAASSSQVAPLLPTGPYGVVLVTSRRRLLGLDAAEPTALPMLDTAEATRLLARIAGAERIAAEPAAAEQVVRHCGHLPLAIRLVGARLAHRPGWTVQDLADRLGAAPSRLAELHAEDRTVTDAFALSYTTLTPEQQLMFRLLGRYPGEWLDEITAAALTGLPLDRAGRLLSGLVDHNLVEEPVAGRFRLHDLIREYAADLAELSGDDHGAALAELLDHYLYVTMRATAELESDLTRLDLPGGKARRPDLLDQRGDPGLEWTEAERPNLMRLVRAAAEAGEHRYACRVARAAARFLYNRLYLDDLRTVMTVVLPSAYALDDPALIAGAHNYLAGATFRAGDYPTAIDSLNEAIRHSASIADHRRVIAMRVNLALVHTRVGDFRRADRMLRDNHREGMRHMGLPDLSLSLQGMAWVHEHLGRLPEALRAARFDLYLGNLTGRRTALALPLGTIGRLRRRLGDRDGALRMLTIALREKEAAGNRSGAAETRNDLAVLFREDGDHARAAELHEQALAEVIALHDRFLEGVMRNDLARTLLLGGDPAAAARLFERGCEQAQRYRHRRLLADATAGLADCLAVTDPKAAARHRRAAAAIHRELDAG